MQADHSPAELAILGAPGSRRRFHRRLFGLVLVLAAPALWVAVFVTLWSADRAYQIPRGAVVQSQSTSQSAIRGLHSLLWLATAVSIGMGLRLLFTARGTRRTLLVTLGFLSAAYLLSQLFIAYDWLEFLFRASEMPGAWQREARYIYMVDIISKVVLLGLWVSGIRLSRPSTLAQR